jgi:choline dehydrogenase-like flavoprotein
MKIVIVGAGPSGLHAAQTALERGQPVTLVDVGRSAAPPPLPDRTFAALKRDHPDPVAYFLGEDHAGAELPPERGAARAEYYRLPPSKDHVFVPVRQFRMQADGIAPLASFAGGGLAECWTAGAYPFDDADLSAFPFGYGEIEGDYATVAHRIGVGGLEDDLTAFLPLHPGLSDPVALNAPSAALLARYDRRRDRLAARHAVRLGRSRQAALSAARAGRAACSRCGRCLWGCPTGALYTPSLTLAQCLKDRRFTYLKGRYASHFRAAADGSLAALVAYPEGGGPAEEIAGDVFILACGALGTSAVFLRTIWHQRRAVAELHGLMDNRQVLAPILNLTMFGRGSDTAAYQYHQLAVGLPAANPAHYVHGQITMFTSGAAHPVIQQLPLPLRHARAVFAGLRSGLGVLNLNFHDTRRMGNLATLDPASPDPAGAPGLRLHYRPGADEPQRIAAALKPMRAFFRDLGAPIIPGMARLRPMGASVHYAGTLPMSADAAPFTVTPDGQSRDFANLYIADGAAFPFLPAKNLTFTLMALATRLMRRLL